VPGRAFRITATGTVVSLLAPSRARAEISVAARGVDLSEGAPWAAAVAASLGKDAGEIPRYLEGAEGIAEGDVRITVAEGALAVSGSAGSRHLTVRGVPLRDVKVEGDFDGGKGPARWSARGTGSFGEGAVRFEAGSTASGGTEGSASVDRLEIAQALSLLRQGNAAGLRGTVRARVEAREGPRGWEIPRLLAETQELSAGGMKFADVRAEGQLGITEGRFSASSSSPRIAADGAVQRGSGWPLTFRVTAAELPTSFLLAAAGRADTPSGGTWSAEAGGVIRLGDLLEGKRFPGETFPVLHAGVRSMAPSVGDVRFEDCRVSGRRQGDALVGEIETRFPDTRLAWTLNLRDPLGFRLEGPFSLGEADAAAPKDGKRRFSLQGRAEVEGGNAATVVARGLRVSV
jgi:hypothetical protein